MTENEMLLEIQKNIKIAEDCLREIQTKLNSFEEKIKSSAVGIELWFSHSDYENKVKSGKKTFEDWFFEKLEDS